MEEEKQHEAAGQQPATEALAESQPLPAVTPEVAPDTPIGGLDDTGVSPALDGAPLEDEDESAAAPSEEQAVASTSDNETPEAPSASGAGREDVAEDIADDIAKAVEDDVEDQPSSSEDGEELHEREPLPGDRDSDPELIETAEPGGAPAGDEPLADDPGSGPDEEAHDATSDTSINAFELIGSTEDQATEAETDAATLKAVLEAIVYVLPEPVPAAQMAAALNQPVERVEGILRELMDDTAKPERGVFIREVAGGYQVATKPEHHEAIRNFVKNLKQPLKLSGAALETLAVIAYKQPVTAPEIMEIRGVQGVGVLKTLLDRKLITTAGRKNVIGKPILYKTTKEFLTQFGLNRISELPTLKEFEEIRRQSISDEEMEERPEAHPSAPLLEQAAALDRTDEATLRGMEDDAEADERGAEDPSGEAPERAQDSPVEPAQTSGEPPETAVEAAQETEADPQPEAPPTPENGPESQENHG
jgi:segregation and condensation protein B